MRYKGSVKRATGLAIALIAAVSIAFALSRKPSSVTDPTELTASADITLPKNRVHDVDRSESIGKETGRLVKSSVLTGIKTSSSDRIGSLLSPDFAGRFPEREDATRIDVPNATLFDLGQGAASLDRAQFIAQLDSWFGGLAAVERASFRIFSVTLDRDAPRAIVSAHFQIAGVKQDGLRTDFQASVDVEMVDGPQYKLRRWITYDATAYESQLEDFRDVAALTGMLLHDSAENTGNAQRVIDARSMPSSGGLTAMDSDDDGDLDVLVTRKHRGATLFLNDGRGGFTPTKLAAIDDRNAASFYLSVDLDNDGRNELVGTQATLSGERDASLDLFTPSRPTSQSTLRRVKAGLPYHRDRGQRDLDYQAIVACDVDGNDLLDLIVVGYTHLESGQGRRNFVAADDGLRNLLFINKGGLKFSEEALVRGVSATKFSFVAECHDFDGDGDVDLFFGNDYAQNDYLANDGAGRFTEDRTHPFYKGRGFSMGISMADFDNRGELAVSISNMYSHAGNRIVPQIQGLSPQMYEVLMGYAAGNTLFERKGGTWVETSKQRRVNVAEWAWSNVFFDADNDMDKDLFVANGFTTHRDPDAPDF